MAIHTRWFAPMGTGRKSTTIATSASTAMPTSWAHRRARAATTFFPLRDTATLAIAQLALAPRPRRTPAIILFALLSYTPGHLGGTTGDSADPDPTAGGACRRGRDPRDACGGFHAPGPGDHSARRRSFSRRAAPAGARAGRAALRGDRGAAGPGAGL